MFSLYYYLGNLACLVQEFVGKLGTGTIRLRERDIAASAESLFVAMIAINHRRRFEVR